MREQICQNCRHWERFDESVYHENGVDISNCGECSAVGAFGIYASREGTGAIYTHESFGCLKFEPK